MRPLRTWCHMLGVWDTHCCDRELRQFMLCVTLSATPRTVTHACYFVGAVNDGRLPQWKAAGMRLPAVRQAGNKMGVSARGLAVAPPSSPGPTHLGSLMRLGLVPFPCGTSTCRNLRSWAAGVRNPPAGFHEAIVPAHPHGCSNLYGTAFNRILAAALNAENPIPGHGLAPPWARLQLVGPSCYCYFPLCTAAIRKASISFSISRLT
jgi:hypothetical protein